MAHQLILPRPGTIYDPPLIPVPGPTESEFTGTFGKLLPAAKFFNTTHGKAAYYDLPPEPSADGPGTGTGAIRRVLLVHGVQTPALGMLPLARVLRAVFPRAHYVLVELWGHGLSDTPVVPHDAALFCDLMDAAFDRLGWPSAHLVGFSFGGALTVGYANSRPGRVESAVLVAPAGLIPSSGFAPGELEVLRGDDDAAARKFVLDFLEGGELIVPDDWRQRVERGEIVAEAVRQWQIRHHAGHMASVVAIVRDGGIMDNDAQFVKLSQSGLQILGVVGDLDPVCNKAQLEAVGVSNVAIVPQAGHGLARERPAEVAAPIISLWKGLEKS